MARHYGMPYMGSKQKLADKIIPFILKRHPEATDFYDLFGGGGSMALYAIDKYPSLKVHYNELSLAIGSLLQYLKDGGEIPLDFVTREDFKAKYSGSDWYAGLLQTCWTFGNNQKQYLYGKDVEGFKSALHDLIVSGRGDLDFIEGYANDQALKKTGLPGTGKIFLDPARYKTPHQRRLLIARQLKDSRLTQHLERMERLEHIKKMPALSSLDITQGFSYKDVLISGFKPVIYCDPPYENTAEYLEGGFDHASFYEWAVNSPYPVYVSSYKVADSRLKLVKSIKTLSLFNSAKSDKPSYNYENVYWNCKGH